MENGKIALDTLFKKIGLLLPIGVGIFTALLFGNNISDERAAHSIFTIAHADILQPDGGGGYDSGGPIGGGTSSGACSASAGTAGTDAGAAGAADGSCGGSSGGK
jgi:hypothetical protein